MPTQTHDISGLIGGISGNSGKSEIKRQNDPNQSKVFKTLGASNHTNDVRQQNDYYATEPLATQLLLELEQFEKNLVLLEPCCGEGHISEELIKAGYNVASSDLIYRCYGAGGIDFFSYNFWLGDIVTNPPYELAQECVEHALKIMQPGSKLAMFLKLTFLEGKSRKKMFLEQPPIRVHVSSSRLRCCKNGDFSVGMSAVCYAWFIWEKGYKGDTVLKWFN